MSRWTGSWLSGSGADVSSGDEQQWRGQRLGFPADGPGSVAGFGSRLGAIFVDWLPCAIAAQLLTTNPGISALVIFALLTVVYVTAFGRTPGHAVVGIRVARLGGDRPDFGAAVVRTVLLCLAVPALIIDADGRGLHDRATGTVAVRTR